MRHEGFNPLRLTHHPLRVLDQFKIYLPAIEVDVSKANGNLHADLVNLTAALTQQAMQMLFILIIIVVEAGNRHQPLDKDLL